MSRYNEIIVPDLGPTAARIRNLMAIAAERNGPSERGAPLCPINMAPREK